MAIATLADARWVDVNESLLRLFGMNRAETVGRTGYELGIWRRDEQREQMLCQHLLPLFVAPPDAQLVAGAPDRLGPVHAEETQQAFVHVDPAGVGQRRDGHRGRGGLEGAAELLLDR